MPIPASMNMKAIMFAGVGLFISAVITTVWVNHDLQRIRRDNAAKKAAACATSTPTAPGAAAAAAAPPTSQSATTPESAGTNAAAICAPTAPSVPGSQPVDPAAASTNNAIAPDPTIYPGDTPARVGGGTVSSIDPNAVQSMPQGDYGTASGAGVPATGEPISGF